MRPEPGELLHFSEDPTITTFAPHVADTAAEQTPYVWAVDASRAPDYWFPRECPRALAWALDTTTEADRQLVLGPNADRVHVIEYGWLDALRTTQLFAYRFAAAEFAPFGDPVHAHVATEPVTPLRPPEPVGELLALHDRAGIEIRVVANLWPYVDAASTCTVGFSGIRLRNARPRDRGPDS